MSPDVTIDEPARPRTVLTVDGLDELIQILRRQGRTVIGPTVFDGVITPRPIESVVELPQGWIDHQDGGTYQLQPTGTDEIFASAAPARGWKRHVYPERSLLVSAVRDGNRVTVVEPDPDPPAMAFVGIRSCDLAALSVLDRVLADPAATDPWYEAARRQTFVVAVACGTPGNTCFCASMDTGPVPTTGYDLALTEIGETGDRRYVVEVGSDRGVAVLAEVLQSSTPTGPTAPTSADATGTLTSTGPTDDGAILGRDATGAEIAEADATHRRAAGAMGRHLHPADPPAAASKPTSPRWEDIADRCLACANCTLVCPTCFCSRTEDVTDLTANETSRYRVWDSCFSLDFSALNGAPVRATTADRYRQWVLHKLVTWHDQFGTSGCVGCGRCIAWCPVGIDLTVEMAALAADRSQS